MTGFLPYLRERPPKPDEGVTGRSGPDAHSTFARVSNEDFGSHHTPDTFLEVTGISLVTVARLHGK